MGTVHNVGDELRAERQLEIVAVDVARFLLIDEEEVVALLGDGDVGVLAHLDVTLGAQD